MDKVMRLALVAAALLGGGGVFYHYVVFLPGVERAMQEAEAAEKRQIAEQRERDRNADAERLEQSRLETDRRQQAAAAREALRRAAYEDCKHSARLNYEANWAQACRTRVDQKLACEYDPRNSFRNNCEAVFGATSPPPDCTLPHDQAQRLDQLAAAAEAKCLAEMGL